MNLVVRAAVEAGAFPFAFAAMAVAMLSMTFAGVRVGSILAAALTLSPESAADKLQR
jgi:hypothetical protein